MSRRPIRELLLGAVIAAVAFACVASPSKGPEFASPPPRTVVEYDARVTEITLLWTEVRRMRQEHDWGSDPSPDLIRAGATCPLETPSNCDETCSLSEHICDNAEDICRIAGDLRGTNNAGWAAEKCEDAKNSCKEAKKRCDCCQDKNGQDDDDADAASGTW